VLSAVLFISSLSRAPTARHYAEPTQSSCSDGGPSPFRFASSTRVPFATCCRTPDLGQRRPSPTHSDAFATARAAETMTPGNGARLIPLLHQIPLGDCLQASRCSFLPGLSAAFLSALMLLSKKSGPARVTHPPPAGMPNRLPFVPTLLFSWLPRRGLHLSPSAPDTRVFFPRKHSYIWANATPLSQTSPS